MNNATPMPPPGSARYFALLYTPRAQRPVLTRLLALADEIGAGVTRGLDHDVAHARLAWWQREAGQYALGQAQHPWLRSRTDEPATAPAIDLNALVQAAAIDLAQTLQKPPGGEQLRRAVFTAAAQLLGAGPLSPALQAILAELATLSWRWEQAPAAASEINAALQPLLARLTAASQSALVPLLLWTSLAGRHAAAKKNSPRRALADNIYAWRLARCAAAGTLSSP
jgi:hypothetical protein